MIQGRRARLRRRTYEILEVARGGDAASRAADVFLIILISANVAAIILESMPAVQAAHRVFFAAFEAFSVAVFTVEYLLRLWAAAEDDRRRGPAARRRLRWAVSPLALCDLLAILPAYLALFVGMDLRFLRVLRLLRLFKLTRYSRAMELLAQVFREEAATFGTTLFILLVMMILASSGIYLVEREAQPDAFGSIPAAMWWAMATLTTVGYGDVTPVTSLGKFFGACITIVGVGMVA
ncbi:MAG: ion transporter, partial [Pseudomonadota bacterium]|nr:ion transporter [Pseudomonadota bacterium]